eukprot:scaffold442_cov268-Pinguiococcus_pyrenoidosus.AAC.121
MARLPLRKCTVRMPSTVTTLRLKSWVACCCLLQPMMAYCGNSDADTTSFWGWPLAQVWKLETV